MGKKTKREEDDDDDATTKLPKDEKMRKKRVTFSLVDVAHQWLRVVKWGLLLGIVVYVRSYVRSLMESVEFRL